MKSVVRVLQEMVQNRNRTYRHSVMTALTLIAVHANGRLCLADNCALPNDCADLAKLTTQLPATPKIEERFEGVQ